jgi:hypothetical protein
MRGRRYALPEDMLDLVPDVLRHRIALSYEALSEGITPDKIIATLLDKIARPNKPISHYESQGSSPIATQSGSSTAESASTETASA